MVEFRGIYRDMVTTYVLFFSEWVGARFFFRNRWYILVRAKEATEEFILVSFALDELMDLF